MTLNAHYNAFVEHLDHDILAGKIDEVVRVTSNGESVRENYVVVGLDLPTPDDHRYTGTQSVDSEAVYRFDTRYVAVNRSGVLLLAQAGRERLLRAVLTVPDRKCDPIRLVDPVEEGRVQWDRTARLFYVDETYEFKSRRA